MDTTFPYDRYVTGRNFIGRRKDVMALEARVLGGESVAVYGEPRTGKMSLIQQMLMHAMTKEKHLVVADVDLLRERTGRGVLKTFVSAVLKSCASSPAEYPALVEEYLGGTHFCFDRDRFDDYGEMVCFRGTLADSDIDAAFSLPSKLASGMGKRLVVLVRQFQAVLDCEESFRLLSSMEQYVQQLDGVVSYIFTGSRLNGMREIFCIKRWFWRSVELIPLSPVDTADIVEYVRKEFQFRGKVIQPEFIELAVSALRGNMWYISHLFSIIDGVARGYVGRDAVPEGIDILLSIHGGRFYSQICSLTDFQLSLLRAVIDGETQLSSSRVIGLYSLNSAANVKRLKDALIKKEILWFDDEDVPHIQDPLFEYWLRKVYFER